MPLFSDAMLDAALAYAATNATTLHACSTGEPASYAAAVSTSLGSVTPTYGAAGAGTPSGRKRTVTPGAGTYSASGTVAAVAGVNTTGSLLVYTVAVLATKAVNSGDAMQLSPFDLTINQPTAV